LLLSPVFQADGVEKRRSGRGNTHEEQLSREPFFAVERLRGWSYSDIILILPPAAKYM
jgi:hypothetical protein